MSCEIHSAYAPNGKPSKLYADILAVTEDTDMALHLWAMSRTKEYKTIMGDYTKGEGAVDENGEPVATDVLGISSFASTPELNDKLKTRVSKQTEEYIETVDKIAKLKSKVSDVLTRRINEIESSKDSKTSKVLEHLTELKKKLDVMDWREMANNFAVEASKTVDYVTAAMAEEIESGDPNMNKLRRLHGYIVGLGVLQEISDQIESSELLKSSMQASLPMIGKVLGDMRGITAKYNRFLHNRVSDKLSSLSTTVDKEAIKNLLEFADGDVHYAERLGYFMGDSKDPILALIAKTVNEAQQKTRRESIEFNHKLNAVIDRLEKENPEYKTNPEKLYAPILEKDPKGNFTGRYITEKSNPTQYVEFRLKYKGTALEEFYDFFNDTYKELNSYLPGQFDMGNRVPSILKTKLDRLKSSNSTLEELKELAKSKIVASNMDASRGQLTDDSQRAVDNVPIKYTQSFDSSVYRTEKKKLIKEGVPEEEADVKAIDFAMTKFPTQISYDLVESLQKFHSMATNYNNMMEIIDVVEGSKEALRTRKVTVTDNKGVPLLTRVIGLNDKRIIIEGSKSNAYAMAESYIAAQVYGQTEDTAGTIGVFGEELDVNKLLKLIKSNTSVLMMGLNVMASTSNILTGETMQWSEAIGGEFWTSKDYAKANKEYIANMLGIIDDIGNRSPKHKINLVNEYYNVLGDYFPGGVGAGESSTLRRALKKGSVHVLSSMGEHSMQTKGMIAFMSHIKTYTASGESTGDLWSAHKEVNGKLEVDKGTYIKNDKGELVEYNQLEKDKVSRKIQTVLRRMHGNYNSETAAAWQKNAYLQLVGQFRKWILDGIARRYMPSRHNAFLETDLEGTYISFVKVLNSLRKDLKAEGTLYGANWGTMTAHQKANAKKTVFEIGMVIAMATSTALLRALASGLDEDDDKELMYATRSMVYFTNRLNSELLFFALPSSTFDILKSPAATMGTGKAIGDVIVQALPWNISEKYVRGKDKGEYKIFNKFKKATPLLKQYERLTPDGIRDQLQFFNLN